MERLPPKVEAARSSRVGCHRARWQVCQTRPSKQMSDLLATISKSTTRTSSICTNGSVCGISLFEGCRGYGGESVSQSPLKDKAFSTFLDQNQPFELRRRMRFCLRQKQVMRRSAIGAASRGRPCDSLGIRDSAIAGQSSPEHRGGAPDMVTRSPRRRLPLARRLRHFPRECRRPLRRRGAISHPSPFVQRE
jgi:hypothetical protein